MRRPRFCFIILNLPHEYSGRPASVHLCLIYLRLSIRNKIIHLLLKAFMVLVAPAAM